MAESYAGYPIIIEKNDFYKRNQHVSGIATMYHSIKWI